jgi:hypothetical protein
VVLEGFLNKENWVEQMLREDVVAVGGNSTVLNSTWHKAFVQRRMDPKALCESFHTMMPATFMDSLVTFFSY